MSPAKTTNAASVRARLLNVAKAQGVDFQQVLVRFALERMLYRLSQSPHANRFLLKGALLFTLWYAMPHRATRDADLLGFGASDLASVADIFRDIAAITVDDGIAFDPASVRGCCKSYFGEKFGTTTHNHLSPLARVLQKGSTFPLPRAGEG